MSESQNHGFITNTIHAGEAETSSATPIYQAATVDGEYLRSGNPTLAAFEEKVRTLEGGACGVSTACGMAAASQTLFSLLKPGDRVVCHRTVYVWTIELMTVVLPRFGIDVDMIDMTDPEKLRQAVRKTTRVVYFEPLANPTLDVIDTQTAITIAHDADATVVIDNTFLSPFLFQPLKYGADAVLHSATKYLCGHGDALAGIVVTRDENLAEEIVRTRNTFGGILSPMNAFLLLRGVKTLSMRMERHCANAQAVAGFLDGHPRIAQVYYPGLPSSAGHEIAKAQWRGFGGMVSFEVENEEACLRFLERLHLCRAWVSLGDVSSLAIAHGGPNRIRMSVGLEDTSDILADLSQALA